MTRWSLLFALSCGSSVSASSSPAPMILVPGLTNSILEYQLVDAEPFKWCPTDTHGKWEPLFPPPNMTLLEEICWQENFATVFNSTTQMYQSSRRGVNVRVVDFGGLSGMPAFQTLIPYWEQLGYKVGENLFGAPYDWRLPTSGRPGTFFSDLKNLVENVSATNNNRRVHLLAPSFGPQFTLGFLHRMTKEWKEKYIDWFIAESPVFSGVYVSLMEYISGAPGQPKFVAGLTRKQMQGIAISSWMFPRAGNNATVTWPATETIIATPKKNYSAYDVGEIYSLLNFTDVAGLKFISQEPDLAQFAHPGVNTFVAYGFGLPSPGPFAYSTDFTANAIPSLSSYVNVSGDSLVPLRSSLRGTVWQDDMEKEGLLLRYHGYENQQHAYCLMPPGVIPGLPDDGCYRTVAALLVNGTIPAQQPPQHEQEIVKYNKETSSWSLF